MSINNFRSANRRYPMSFKIYNNRKTKHPSVSIKSGDKKYWHNLEVTHHPTSSGRYIEIDNIDPLESDLSYLRKFVRKDKHKIKSYRYKRYRLTKNAERKVKKYLKKHFKKKR